MKVKLAFLLLIFANSPEISIASNNNTSVLEDGFCTYGSHKELYKFFTEKNYAVIAQGKRVQPNADIKDFADVLFLISPDMEYFHTVTLNGIRHDYFKACIFSSAREVDYQFTPPAANLLSRKNREHIVMLADNMQKNTRCPDDDRYCTPWAEWSQNHKQTFLLSAYAYSTQWEHDPYNEIVELTLDNKVIRPTRGTLSEHARIKYALRLKKTLDESNEDSNSAKSAYKQIHNETDHKLALVFFSLTDARHWSLDEVDREKGLVQNVLHGVELEIYPMPGNAYKKFSSK